MFRFLGKLILFLIKWGFILALTIILIVFGIKMGYYAITTYPKSCIGILVGLIILAGIDQGNEKDKVAKYFHKKQVGSIEDIKAFTNIEETNIKLYLKEFLESNKVELLVKTPEIYKWTENRHYPEGMISKEITL